jgi:hypothetical protein
MNIYNEYSSKQTKDTKAVKRLLNKQDEICSKVLNELKIYNKKTTHWSWYIFPTDKPGNADPLQIYVTIDTAKILLECAPYEWRLCLEKIIELAIKKNYTLQTVLPEIDIGRVRFFITFWKTISDKPVWLSDICDVLELLI